MKKFCYGIMLGVFLLSFTGCKRSNNKPISHPPIIQSPIESSQENARDNSENITEVRTEQNALESRIAELEAKNEELLQNKDQKIAELESRISELETENSILAEQAKQYGDDYNNDSLANIATVNEVLSEGEVHNIIQIHEELSCWVNSASGVAVRITYTNKSSKTIKYITFDVEPYNAVGDKVYSEIGGKCLAHLRETGPIEPDGGAQYKEIIGWVDASTWSNVWYNNTVKTIKLLGIKIEYMDGSEVKIGGEALNYVFW